MRAAVVTAVVLAALPAPAGAAPLSFVDDTSADFAAAPPSASTWAVEPGEVRLRPAVMSEGFDGLGPDLPAGLTATPWSPPAGSATVGAGALGVDAARVHPEAMQPAPLAIEFRAAFADREFQHIGFGDTFAAAPWAMFSTGGGELPVGLYARSLAPGGTPSDTPIAIDPRVPHLYRIEWAPLEVRFFVDGALVETHAFEITTGMRPVVSDLGADPAVVTVDWLGVGELPASGTFESRVHDAGDPRAVWGTATTAPAGIGIETRSGDTPAPDGDWSAWQPTGTNGEIASPSGRYLQYRATLVDGTAPVLDGVEIGYEIDTVPPAATIDDVTVDGATATMTFASEPGARFECRLGDGAYAACASPHTLTDLADDTYTIHVRATDAAGNEGEPATRTFTIDTVAPTTTIEGVQVDGDTATVTFASEPAARFECRLDDGEYVACTTPHTLTDLDDGSHTVHVRAIDAAGNVGAPASRSFTIARPPTPSGSVETPPPATPGHDAPAEPQPEPEIDDVAPVIDVLTQSRRVTRRGVVKVSVGCPETEVACEVTVWLKHRDKTTQRKTTTLEGGETSKVRLRLRRATRNRLESRSRLKVKLVVKSRDQARNVEKTKHELTVRAPRTPS